MNEQTSDIAFVTVNYNTHSLVADMLSFFQSADLPFSFQLVIVDNNSTDGSHEMLSQQSCAAYIPAGKNLGYGRAINLGIAATASRYICALNTDVILDAKVLTKLWIYMQSHPECGVVSPRIVNRDGSTQGFIFFHSPLSILFNPLSKLLSSTLKRRIERATRPLQVDGVLGAFFLIRRSAFSDNQLFDEDFFFYYEDTDLAHRLMHEGVRCIALPDCALVHLGGSSTSIEGAKIFYKSKRTYLEKHYGRRFAERIATLDRFRLNLKSFKYRLLSSIIGTVKIKQKRDFYSAMQQAITPGGDSK